MARISECQSGQGLDSCWVRWRCANHVLRHHCAEVRQMKRWLPGALPVSRRRSTTGLCMFRLLVQFG